MLWQDLCWCMERNEREEGEAVRVCCSTSEVGNRPGGLRLDVSLSQVLTYRESFLVERSCMCSWKAKCNVIIASRDKFFPCVLTDVFVQVIFPLALG